MKVDAKKLKSRLTVEDHKAVMKALDIPAFAENKDSIVYWSGEKNKDALKGSPKLYYYKSSGIYVGYTSSASYDIIGLVQKRLSLLNQPSSFIDSINFILTATGIDPNACQRLTSKSTYNWEDDLGKYIRFRKTGSSLPIYDKQILDDLDHSYPQSWIDEGISIDSMEKYGIGYYERTNAITIPCMDKEGNLIGIRVRNQRPDLIEQAKYIPLTLLDGTCYKFNTNSALYGLNYNWAEIERSGVVKIVEGEKSVLKLDTIMGEACNAVAMYGSNLGTYRRNELLKLGVKKVELIVDNDFIGQNDVFYKDWQTKIQKQADIWKGYSEVWLIWDNMELLDPKDNALDKGVDIWNELYESKERIV